MNIVVFLDVTDFSLIKVYWYPLGQYYISTKLNDVTFQKIVFIVTVMRTLSLKYILCLFLCLTMLKITLKNMYLFMVLVYYINSDVISALYTYFLSCPTSHTNAFYEITVFLTLLCVRLWILLFFFMLLLPQWVLQTLASVSNFEHLLFNISITSKYVTVEMKWKCIFVTEVSLNESGNIYEPFL
jgi:hypothetical protein